MVQCYAVSTLHTLSQMHYITDFRISVFSGIAAAAAAGSNQDKINTHLAGHFKLAMSLSLSLYALALELRVSHPAKWTKGHSMEIITPKVQ